jgi:hypothetical protein
MAKQLARDPTQTGLLAEHLSEHQAAAELQQSLRTLRLWRQQGRGLREARTTAAQLAPFQAPTFRAVAVSTPVPQDKAQDEPGDAASIDDPHTAKSHHLDGINGGGSSLGR